MAANKDHMNENLGADAQADARLRAVLDSAMTAIMLVDRDLRITYVNAATRRMLAPHVDEMRRIYPGFDPERLEGRCIDDFHRDPSRQRRLLADPNNLPFVTDIEVGPLKFNLNVSALYDERGAYVGNMLEWHDVTALRDQERMTARFRASIEGSASALMMCDENRVINYMNPAALELFRRRERELAQLWPGFRADDLIGRCIDDFHRHPEQQRSLLSDPARMPFETRIRILDLEFNLKATLARDEQGRYIGNMVEWTDVTEQRAAERELGELVDKAARGKLDERIDASRYSGFVASMGEAVNRLLDAISVPLAENRRVLEALQRGDLTQRIETDFGGEFDAMRNAVNGAIEGIAATVEEIRSIAEQVATSSGEIAQGNADLSQRTEEQASSLEETASSMEELTSSVKQNADNAARVEKLSREARNEAVKGGEAVGETVAAMGEIRDASRRIADIITVIDEIAFQTNLLALNAAVEAARAGEQGRGFAVVAAEVRNLAKRSATAAKEIKALISETVSKVEEGGTLVDRSGETLQGIVRSFTQVSELISEIAAASQEQAAGIEQINKAVLQLDEVTQQNAALVEEAAAASENLDDQAGGLIERMAFFETGTTTDSDARQTARSERRARAEARRSATRRPERRPRKPVVHRHDDDEWEEF